MFLDFRRQKYNLVQAYCDVILSDADRQEGKICVSNSEEVKTTMKAIREQIRKQGNTHDVIKYRIQRVGKNPITKKMIKNYNKLGATVKKHFKENDSWIPSLLVLNLLYEYQLKGYKDFENFDLLGLIGEFEKYDRDTSLANHFKCAGDVFEVMNKKG